APVRARAAMPAEPAAPVLTEEVAPIAAPVAEPVQPIAEPAPAPVEKAATGGDSFPWEIAGGAAALLVAGAAGFALMRRRRAANEVWEFDESHRSAEWVPSAEPTFAREEIARADITAAPVAAAVPAQPVTAAAPGFTPVPAGSMGRHEALAMAGPTPDNPFTTLSKRLARARFLDRQERADYDAALATSQPQTEQAPVRKPVSAWEISQRQTVPAPAEQEVRRLQPGSIRKDLKPGWTRN
uniref:LAETG motif-containing sortase-dependent surface protein n=1 Tax=Sphingopyxis sp. TaxID=1908224 RepID=UPI0035B14E52